MDKKRLPFKNQEEIIRCMEREIQQQKEVIRTQNEQIRFLKNQIKPNPNQSSFPFLFKFSLFYKGFQDFFFISLSLIWP